ncbi:MAG TPA: PilN domain-containing protein [Blastocatellia bacterium]
MIKVNLLEGTAEQRAVMQKTKVAARRGQQVAMLGAALLIALIAIFVDHVLTNSAYAAAKNDLSHEQEEAKKLEADKQRKLDIENELKQVDERIRIIKELRAEQKGPVAMLSSINERMPGGTSDFTLQSIIQKGTHLQIIGIAPNQQTVSDFAHRLEFSQGMFTRLNLVIEGKSDEAVRTDVPAKKPDGTAGGSSDDDLQHSYKFTIDCDYNKPHDSSSEESGDTAKPATAPAK